MPAVPHHPTVKESASAQRHATFMGISVGIKRLRIKPPDEGGECSKALRAEPERNEERCNRGNAEDSGRKLHSHWSNPLWFVVRDVD